MGLAVLALGLLHCGGKDSTLFAQPSCSDQGIVCMSAGGSAGSGGGSSSIAGGSNGGSQGGGASAGAGGTGNSSAGNTATGGVSAGGGGAQGGSTAIGGGGSAGQASGGSSSCVTAFSAGTLKFGFDTAPSGGALTYPADPTGEGPACTGPVSHSTALYTSSEGHQCPGAIEVTIPFGEYVSPNALTAAINFPSADWRAYSKLHAWVKVRAPDIAVPKTNPLFYLGPVRLAVASSSAGMGTSDYLGYSSSDSDIGPFSDRGWHEITLQLVQSSTYFANAVLNVAVQISAQPTAPDHSPAKPPDTVVEIDDIWLE